MSIYLLDVNVLIALADPLHLHHEAAHRWFADKGAEAWATCPLTENGFVRVASHPKYPNRPGSVETVVAILKRFCAHPGHHFWPDVLTVRELLVPGAVVSHSHLTDLYLLGLALHNGGKLATFDDSIPAVAVAAGRDALEKLPALT